MTRIKITKRFSVLSFLVVLGLAVVTVLLVTKFFATAASPDWPPFVMIYQIEGGGVTVGTGPIQTGQEVHRLDYRSKTEWTDTVIEAPEIETSFGTFSTVGSYRHLDGRTLSEFDPLENSFLSRTIPEGVRMVPGAALIPRPIEVLKAAGAEYAQVVTSAKVCFRDVCKQNAGGLMYVDNGQERVFANDSRGIPLKVGDSFFTVLELRIEDEQR